MLLKFNRGIQLDLILLCNFATNLCLQKLVHTWRVCSMLQNKKIKLLLVITLLAISLIKYQNPHMYSVEFFLTKTKS